MKLTPRRAIRQYCIDCVGGIPEVKDCQGDTLIDGPCVFYPYRMGRGRPSVKTIRKNCIYCMNKHINLIRDCPSKGCVLKPYRMGTNPRKQGQGNISNLKRG